MCVCCLFCILFGSAFRGGDWNVPIVCVPGCLKPPLTVCLLGNFGYRSIVMETGDFPCWTRLKLVEISFCLITFL